MSRSHDSMVRSHGRTGSQHVNLPQVFRRRQQGETSAQTHVPERDAVLQKLEYLTRAIERLEKNQATTKQISDSEVESPAPKQKNASEEFTTDRHSPFTGGYLGKAHVGKAENATADQLTRIAMIPWITSTGQFISTFMGARTRSTPKERLVSIKQGRTETLRSYMDRFSKRIVEVDKISDDAALMAVLSGLRTRTRFWWSVHENGPATYQEFLARAEQHIGA
ncbi:Retrotrans gag domain-containing protein [Abeliophyllum distichum]|uniref:Retrotrans gag domain-containing protein n=1 Tax=Abeliophyllum distichum TaxID=126358 RepID=A0ABD1RR95_9LAMI